MFTFALTCLYTAIDSYTKCLDDALEQYSEKKRVDDFIRNTLRATSLYYLSLYGHEKFSDKEFLENMERCVVFFLNIIDN